MANYIVSRYCTGVLSSVDAAQEALELRLEDMDSTAHPVLGMGVSLVRRGRQQAVGWLLYQGYEVLAVPDAAHVLTDAGIVVTTNP